MLLNWLDISGFYELAEAVAEMTNAWENELLQRLSVISDLVVPFDKFSLPLLWRHPLATLSTLLDSLLSQSHLRANECCPRHSQANVR